MDKRRASKLIARNWLAVAIACVLAAAWISPGLAPAILKWHVLDIGVVVVMFLGSLKLDPGRFRAAASKPGHIVLSLISVFVLAPCLSLLVASFFGFATEEDRLAVLISSAQASTLATGIVLTEIAGGEVALAMVMTIVNNFATVLFTPLAFKLLGGADIQVDYTAMSIEMTLKIVLPVVVAQLIRKPIAGFAVKHSHKLSIISQLIILIYIYAGVASALERLHGFKTVLLNVVFFAATLHALMLVINAIAAKAFMKSTKDRVAFVFCSSQKTLPAAILIWKSYFYTTPLGPVVAVAYHVIQLVVDSLMAPDIAKLPIINDNKKLFRFKGEKK